MRTDPQPSDAPDPAHPVPGLEDSEMVRVYELLSQGQTLYAQGRHQHALERLSRALELAPACFLPGHPVYGACVVNIADLHMALGNHQTAERLVAGYLDELERSGYERAPMARQARNVLANLYVRAHRWEQAERVALGALRRMPRGEPERMATWLLLVMVFAMTGRAERARRLVLRMAALLDALPPEHPDAEEAAGTLRAARDVLKGHDGARPAPLDHEAYQARGDECLGLFLARDFARAARLALELVMERPSTLLLQIHLVSMAWLGVPVDPALESALEGVEEDVWERRVSRFTLGRAPVEHALAVARDGRERCATWFFAGMLALRHPDLPAARQAFVRAAEADPGSPMARTARVEIQDLDCAAGDEEALDAEVRARVDEFRRAFATHDYAAAVQIGADLATTPGSPPDVCLLRVAALRALGRAELAADMVPPTRRVLVRFPWHARLLDLLLEKAPPQLFVDQAQDPVQRCQASYYAAVCMRLRGRWDEARLYLDAALAQPAECAERRLAQMEGHDAGAMLAHLARRTQLLVNTGRVEEAEEAARATLAWARAHASDDPGALATALSNLAAAVAQRGRLAEALHLLGEAEALLPRLDDDTALAHRLNLGQVLLDADDHVGAHQVLAPALAAAEHASPQVRGALLNALGRVHLARMDPQGALSLHEAALRELERQGRAAALQRAIMQDNAANCLHMLGRGEEAIARHQRAREELAALVEAGTVAAGHPSVVKNLENLAAALLDAGRVGEAERHAREGVRLASQGDWTAVSARLVLCLACWAAGRPDEALEVLLDAAAVGDGVLGDTMARGSESLRMAYLFNARVELSLLLSLVGPHFRDDAARVERVLDVVLRRKALAAEAAVVQRDAMGRYPSLRPLQRELEQVRQALAAAALAGPGGAAPDQVQALLERERRLDQAIAREVPELHLGLHLREVSARAVVESVPANWVIVEYLRVPPFPRPGNGPLLASRLGETRYWAFVVSAGKGLPPGLVDLGPAGELDERVRAYRSVLAAADPARALSPEGVAAGRRLRQAAWDPVAARLPEQGHAVLALDGALVAVPFEALPREDAGYLADRYTFSYVGTSRDLLRLWRGAREPSGPPVVAAAPDFGLGTDPAFADILPFPPLPATEREGRRVATLLGVEPWTGAQVTWSRIRGVSSPRVLHLATHGFFAPVQGDEDAGWGERVRALARGAARAPVPANPLLRSGLALAGANTAAAGGTPPAEAGNGLLTAVDVLGMDLRGTELVVLSACETGLGPLHVTEGVMGLRRAFLLAGGRSVVVSLWRVDDEVTCEVMEGFYRRLARGMSRAEALCAAQLAVRARHPSPALWAAFVCYGATSPVWG